MTRRAICVCGWNDSPFKGKHKSTEQLKITKVLDDKGFIINKKILELKERLGGTVDICWCPKCGSLIETYLDE